MLAQEQARFSFMNRYEEAGLSPLRCIYYSYLREFHKEPEDVLEMLKGYSYIEISRRVYGR